MICDHSNCRNPPTRAPRLIVPGKTWLAPGHKPMRMMTALHYCEMHRGDVQAADLLSDKVKADFEKIARQSRPLDFRCDFEKAFIEHVLVTTPEYVAWMARVNIGQLVAGGNPEARAGALEHYRARAEQPR